jgi:hypothetical protein
MKDTSLCNCVMQPSRANIYVRETTLDSATFTNLFYGYTILSGDQLNYRIMLLVVAQSVKFCYS